MNNSLSQITKYQKPVPPLEEIIHAQLISKLFIELFILDTSQNEGTNKDLRFPAHPFY